MTRSPSVVGFGGPLKADRKGSGACPPKGAPGARQAPRFSFCAKTLEKLEGLPCALAIIIGLCAASCRTGETIELPRLDTAAVERAFPELAGRIREARPDRRGEAEPASATLPGAWATDESIRLRSPFRARVTFEGDEREYTVTDGRIELAGAAPVEVEGRTLGEARRLLTEAVRRTHRNPSVGLEVWRTAPASIPRIHVALVGSFNRWGEPEGGFPSGVRINQALEWSGGFAPDVAANQVFVIHGDRTVTVVDWVAFVDGARWQDVRLADGDVLYAAPRYDLSLPYAPAWGAIAAYARGETERDGLVAALRAVR